MEPHLVEFDFRIHTGPIASHHFSAPAPNMAMWLCTVKEVYGSAQWV